MLTYEDTELSIDNIPSLLVSEYKDCRRILQNELMFSDAGLPRMYAWALKDTTNVETVNWNFTNHRDN